MNKKKVIGLSLFSLILLLFVIILYSNKYKKQVYTEEGNNQIRTGTNISMMLETKAGSGDYEPSTSSEWPTEGYTFMLNVQCVKMVEHFHGTMKQSQ